MNVRRTWPVHLVGLLVLLGGLLALKGFNPFREGVWGGMATHLMQAASIARDGDLRYTTADIDRWADLAPIDQGPRGLLLRASDEGSDVEYGFGAPFLYALASAAFLAAIGPRGLLVVNVVSLAAIVWLLARWWSRDGRPWSASIFAAAVIGFSLAPAYVFVMEPDLFRAAILAAGLALAFGSLPRPAPAEEGAGSTEVRADSARPSVSWWRVATGFALLGLATYEKPLLGVFLLYALVHLAFWRRWKALGLGLTVGLLAWVGPTAMQRFSDGGLGERRQYVHGTYPLTDEQEAFSAGRDDEAVLGDGGAVADLALVPEPGLRATLSMARANLGWNAVYFLVGRQTGLVAYAPGVLVCVLLFVFSRGRRETAALLVGVLVTIAFFLLLRPMNYFGGPMAFGNRNLLPLLPAAALLAPALPRRRRWLSLIVGPVVVAGAVFLRPMFESPRFAVLGRFNRMKQPGLSWLPVDVTQARHMFTWPREVVELTGGCRLYRMSGTSPSATLGMRMAPDHLARFVAEASEAGSPVRVRAFGGPDGVAGLVYGGAATAERGLFPGECRILALPMTGAKRVVTEDGPRWLAEVTLHTVAGPSVDARIALALKPAWSPLTFAWRDGTLDLSRDDAQHNLLWGWSGVEADAANVRHRVADEADSYVLTYAAPGRDCELIVIGRLRPADEASPLRVSVAVNNEPIGALSGLSADWNAVRCRIPASALSDDVTTIRLSAGEAVGRFACRRMTIRPLGQGPGGP